MKEEIHLTAKDFTVQWYSGTGKGGQHRNKHQNCCRIIHKASGLKAQGTESRERTANQRLAFTRLAKLILAHNEQPSQRRDTSKTIRNYHAVRNECHDKASGLKLEYKKVVIDGELGPMIDARRMAVGSL